MKRIRLIFLFICLVLIVAACSNRNITLNNSSGSDNTDPSQDKQVAKQTVTEEMKAYFLPDGSTAHYKGEGNEYAELIVSVSQPDEQHVIVQENNGGSLMRHIYRVKSDEIAILQSEAIDQNTDFPSSDELAKMKEIGTYLKKPLKVGTSFDEWTVVEEGVTVETPYQTFKEAFVLEAQQNEITQRKYFVKDYGEIKRESIMKTDGEEDFIVTSLLSSVTKEQ